MVRCSRESSRSIWEFEKPNLRMQTQLVIQAVLMALWQKQSRAPIILHSDRGSQFTSHEYQCFLKDHNITSSMSAVGSCYDNAAAESFFVYLNANESIAATT
jgi:transposase InsO family protein